MAEEGVSSVAVVDSDDRLAGVLTATDYVRFTAEGTDPVDTSVARYMHSDIVSVAADGPVETVAETMAALGVRHVPVTDDDGTVVGMLSARTDRR
jgi:CBS domain-containing protein